jgi:hypothetical protein
MKKAAHDRDPPAMFFRPIGRQVAQPSFAKYGVRVEVACCQAVKACLGLLLGGPSFGVKLSAVSL